MAGWHAWLDGMHGWMACMAGCHAWLQEQLAFCLDAQVWSLYRPFAPTRPRICPSLELLCTRAPATSALSATRRVGDFYLVTWCSWPPRWSSPVDSSACMPPLLPDRLDALRVGEKKDRYGGNVRARGSFASDLTACDAP
eukprot:359498-Chlamydomonas_euryale.AAC.1